MLESDMHAWRYGSAPEWARYTRYLQLRLQMVGIPAERVKRMWYGNPATAQWEVSFPARMYAAATRVADALPFPKRVSTVSA